MKEVECCIYAKYIVTVDESNRVLENHVLVHDAGRIVDIVSWVDADEKYHAKEYVDLKQSALMPGLINAHTHACMTLFRGLADDKPLTEWLIEDIWPAEAKFVNPEFVRDGTAQSAAEMIRSGTTCFNDMYFYPESSINVLEEIGMRAMIGQIVLDFPTHYASGPEKCFTLASTIYSRYKNSNLIKCSIAPHAPYTVGDKSFKRINELSLEWNVPIHLHLHETVKECEDSENMKKDSMNCHLSDQACRPLANLKRLGLLSARLIAVHMTELTNDEIDEVAKSGTHVVHCPTSNLKLASGLCRVSDLLDAGVNVAIGTDGASSNNSLNMFSEMKLAAILAKAVSKKCTAVPAETALRMATINGAIALGMKDEIGSLEPGKAADVVAISLDNVEMRPIYNIVSHLVYVAGREEVSDVWIAGQRVLKNRRLVTLDEDAVKKSCCKWQHKISDFHDAMDKAIHHSAT